MNKIDPTSQEERVLAAVPLRHPGLGASDLIAKLSDVVPATRAMGVINAAIAEGTVKQDRHFRYVRADASTSDLRRAQ